MQDIECHRSRREVLAGVAAAAVVVAAPVTVGSIASIKGLASEPDNVFDWLEWVELDALARCPLRRVQKG